MNENLLRRLSDGLRVRGATGLRRQLEPRSATDTRLNLADNDYLGLSRDPVVVEAAIAALREWGASSSASPLVTGYTEVHQRLEQTLAVWHGYAHCLVMNTGFAANSAVLGGLPSFVNRCGSVPHRLRGVRHAPEYASALRMGFPSMRSWLKSASTSSRPSPPL